MENVICASVTVVKPRVAGQPMNSAIRMNSIRDEIPVMTSGIISGAVTSPENSTRPRNLRNRASAMPAMVPRIVANVADSRAIFNDNHAAFIICGLSQRATYHFVENPPQTVARRDALKE